jgi:hypothetical protein
MSCLSLKPSEIMYSQSSIANKFIKGDHGQIGEVLDDIMEDRLPISRLPTIEVKCIDGPLTWLTRLSLSNCFKIHNLLLSDDT